MAPETPQLSPLKGPSCPPKTPKTSLQGPRDGAPLDEASPRILQDIYAEIPAGDPYQ